MENNKTPEQLAEEFRRTKRPHDYKREQAGEWCTGPRTIHDKACFLAGYQAAQERMLRKMEWLIAQDPISDCFVSTKEELVGWMQDWCYSSKPEPTLKPSSEKDK